MSKQTIVRLDALNPGQYFACCGLLDLLSRRTPRVRGHFQLRADAPRSGEFILEGAGEEEVRQLLLEIRGGIYAPAEHAEEAIAPIQARIGTDELELDWWLDVFREAATSLKCWGGQVTSGRLFPELASLIEPDLPAQSLFQFSAFTKSKFGVDPRSAWNALDFGYSPNEHSQDAATYPMVELLAAFGLQGFRPVVETRTVTYCAWANPLPASVARLAAFSPWEGLALSAFSFDIAKRGQGYKYFTFAKLRETRRYFL